MRRNDYTYDTNNMLATEMMANWYDTVWQTYEHEQTDILMTSVIIT